LQSLVQLTLRFTSSLSLRTAAGLADALIEMGNLMYLELWSAKS
jgi:DNA-binding transcriptional regulator/RsmH inhibitor MraZ